MGSISWNKNVDIVDDNRYYMNELMQDPEAEMTLNKWRDWVEHNLPEILFQYLIPEGKIIQAGVWNGDFYTILKEIFGGDRCIGFDIVKYIEDDSVIYSDFRDLKDEHQFPCALFYNGMGNWLYNKKSKTSGLEYAKRNLVQGGLYLDSIHMDTTILKDVEGLNYMATYDDRLIILRKE